MDYVSHRVISTLRVARGDQAEIVHERHQLRNVGFCLAVPNRSGMTARLISTVNTWRDHRSRHGFQFLTSHRASGVLRTDDVHFNANVRTGMQRGIRSYAQSIPVEDLFNSGQTLGLNRNFLRWCVNQSGFNPQNISCNGLQLLAEDNSVRTASLHEFNFLRCERRRNVRQLCVAVVELVLFGVNSKYSTCSH